MGRKQQPFSLPEEARRSLKELLHKGVHASRVLNRARILLKLDEGQGPLQVSKEVSVGVATVYKTRNKANEKGWEVAIAEPKRSGRGPVSQAMLKRKLQRSLVLIRRKDMHAGRFVCSRTEPSSSNTSIRYRMKACARSLKKRPEASFEKTVVYRSNYRWISGLHGRCFTSLYAAL